LSTLASAFYASHLLFTVSYVYVQLRTWTVVGFTNLCFQMLVLRAAGCSYSMAVKTCSSVWSQCHMCQRGTSFSCFSLCPSPASFVDIYCHFCKPGAFHC